MVTLPEIDHFESEAAESNGFGWFALIVRSNLSRTLADVLENKGFEAFAPCSKRLRRWCDRTAVLETPLFPGYVFVKFSLSQKLAALKTPGVYGIVEFGKKPAEIPAEEIQSLKALVNSGLPIVPHAFVQRGDTVRIMDGPLSGVTGIVLDDRKAYRILVSVKLIERAVAVEVDRDAVRAWKPSPSLQLARDLLRP